jgi:hypothetical protein
MMQPANAFMLLGVFRARNMSTDDQEAVLKELNRLDREGHLQLNDSVPATARSLQNIAEQALSSTRDVEPEGYYFDTRGLRQTQKCVALYKLSVVSTIQEMLLDRRIPQSDWFFEKEPRYVFDDDTPVTDAVSQSQINFPRLKKARYLFRI